ncbi:hypothetical protein DRQ20_00410 [bacterium]|nr:MAG: hypothetical protein DRQ20_00410 [bacterium]
MKPEIVIFSAKGKKSFSFSQIERLEKVGNITFHAVMDPLPKEVFISLAKHAEILGITRRPLKDFDREIAQSLPRLRGIAIYSTGYDWIDVEFLKKKGVSISYLPDYATVTVAEHAIGMLLALSRKIPLAYLKASGLLTQKVSLKGWEIYGKKHGIIGLGRIGTRVAQLGKCMGMEVYYYDPVKKISYPFAIRVRFEEILKSMDVITICASYQRGYPPIIGRNEMEKMKNGIYIINVSRKELVDHEALVEFINNGKIAGYALDDVLEPDILNKLSEKHRIILTAHTAWYSEEALSRGTEMWVENIIGLATGNPKNII